MGSIVASVMKWDNMLAILFATALGYLSSRLLPQIIVFSQQAFSAIFPKTKLYSTLEGKHVVVTGGSSGIDYAIAEHALKEGASVTLIAQNPDKLQQVKASLIQELNCSPGAVHIKVNTPPQRPCQ
jgi:NADPH:quinone reductase-like Zn-dependent oxidoreductase